jgi:hypothetical protein
MTPRQVLDATDSGELTLVRCNKLLNRYRLLVQSLNTLPVTDLASLIDQLFPEAVPDITALRDIALLVEPSCKTPLDLLTEMKVLITQPDLPGEDDNVIRIMSLHKAKGLTARLVVVAGCVEGAIPLVPDGLPTDEATTVLEEQRRLFYVAITRSTDTLVLSSAARIKRQDALTMRIRYTERGGGDHVVMQTSRFLSELGPNRPPTLTAADWRKRVAF